jgi:hypothetical protein
MQQQRHVSHGQAEPQIGIPTSATAVERRKRSSSGTVAPRRSSRDRSGGFDHHNLDVGVKAAKESDGSPALAQQMHIVQMYPSADAQIGGKGNRGHEAQRVKEELERRRGLATAAAAAAAAAAVRCKIVTIQLVDSPGQMRCDGARVREG